VRSFLTVQWFALRRAVALVVVKVREQAAVLLVVLVVHRAVQLLV
jgi:hypothetical protein